MSSVFQFVINMDRFLTREQGTKEAEVEEVYAEENFETQTAKRNTVQVFKFNEKWKDGRLCSAEDGKMFCSHCKEFEKKQKQIYLRL